MISKSALEALFTPVPPASFMKMGNGHAHIRLPYSPKNFRRLRCETHLVFAVCVQLEWDPSCARYNERPAPVPYSTKNGDEHTLKVKLISQSVDGRVTFHRAGEKPQADHATPLAFDVLDYTSDPFTNWAVERGCFVNRVNLAQVLSNKTLFDAQRQLWHWVSVGHRRAPVDLERQMLQAISARRTVTIYALLQQFGGVEECQALRAIAQLLMAGRASSDIDRHHLSYATELTVFDV
jgi:hypothetical protein